MANDSLKECDLLVLLERREEFYEELLKLSQRQFTETETAGWNWLLDRKQEYIDELLNLEQLLDNWEQQHIRDRRPEEIEFLKRSGEILKRLNESEEEFEKKMLQEKNLVSREMDQLRKQLNYSFHSRVHSKIRAKRIS